MTASDCTCPPCVLCRGTGTIAVDMRGRAIACRMDDLDSLEPCEDCGGSGIAAECDCCRDLREQDESADDEWTAEDAEYFRYGTRYPGQ